MDEVILPFEWHSFCISINIGKKRATVVHNGKIQAIQLFRKLDDNVEDQDRFMTVGHLGGAKFLGKLIDFEVFGRPLSDQEISHWTLCNNQGINSIFIKIMLLFQEKSYYEYEILKNMNLL